jgi:hypothetical protein
VRPSRPRWPRSRTGALQRRGGSSAEQKAKADARRQEQEQEERCLRPLIERGKSRALTKTLGWDFEDAQEARTDVARPLKDEVESDWTDREVDDLVDEVLDEWEEDDE